MHFVIIFYFGSHRAELQRFEAQIDRLIGQKETIEQSLIAVRKERDQIKVAKAAIDQELKEERERSCASSFRVALSFFYIRRLVPTA